MVIRLRTIAALSLLLGCTEMPPRPGPGGDGSPSADAPDALVDRDVPAPLDAPDADVDRDVPAPLDAPDADVAPPDVLPDADVPPPDAPPATGPRLTGTFVSSGTSTGRLSGGFVWHGGSARLSGWLQ